MKKTISALVVAGILSQAANAMGPTGDLTHRHFYKDQEWIWNQEQSQPNAQSKKDLDSNLNGTPFTFVMPGHPPLAFVMPGHPPFAFVMPGHPPFAFVMPDHPRSELLISAQVTVA
jgi:hypothetical protein